MTRLVPILERDALPEEHRGVFDYLVETRGRVSPGMGVLLHSPDVTGRIVHVGSYVRFESALPPRVREVAALAASSEMQNAFEQAAHTPGALQGGASEQSVQTIKERGPLELIDEEDRLPVRCARELFRDHDLPQATFDEALAAYGERGVIDLFSTIGYYSMLACLHKALDVQPSPIG
jgi:4-carboxymuconolactone decarboxylase